MKIALYRGYFVGFLFGKRRLLWDALTERAIRLDKQRRETP